MFDRLSQYLDYKGLTPYNVENALGLSRGSLYKSIRLKSNIGSNVLMKIAAAYRDLNLTWLLTGEGDMLKSEGAPGIENDNDSERFVKEYARQAFASGDRQHANVFKELYEKMREDRLNNAVPIYEYNEDLELIKKEDGTEFRHLGDERYLVVSPLVEQYAYGGYIAGWSDSAYIEDLPKHAVVMKDLTIGVYRSFEVKGDSMDDGTRESIADGDILTCRKLYQKYWKSRLHLHQYKYFVLVTDDGIVIKEVREHRVGEGVIVCHSLNPDKEKYPDFELPLETVREIYYVKSKTQPIE